MKALSNNGTITIYQSVPDSFTSSIGTVMGGGKNMTDEQLKEHGIYDCNYPDGYNPDIHDLSDSPEFDSERQVYNYTKTDKIFTETLEELKTKKITHLKSLGNSRLQETDWYIVRKADAGTAVPSSITTHRAAVRTKCASMETSITNAADTPALETLYTRNKDGVRPLGELPRLES